MPNHNQGEGNVAPFESLAATLAAKDKPLKVFFRDDDGGWVDSQLQALADEFETHGLPLDIAVIPAALSDQSVKLIDNLITADNKISIHQHGFSHTNHQTKGRSCEFGSERGYQQQLDDIAAGQQILNRVFKARVCPIFTPPWNRCTSDTVAALGALNFSCFSRITGSDQVSDALTELPVAVDWLKKRKGVSLDETELASYICDQFSQSQEVVGIMLHHEHMDAANRARLRSLIDVLRDSGKVSFHPMMELVA